MSKSNTARKIILALTALGILLVGIAGYKALVRSGKKRPTSQPKRLITEVETITVKRENVLTHLTGYGTVRGKREVLIIPEVGGKIISISPNFKSGKTVGKDEHLFAIDSQTTRVKIDQIKAEISKLRAQIQSINQEADNTKRNLEIITDNVNLAEKEVKKNESLIAKNMVSEQTLDASRQRYLREKNSKINYENQLAMIPLKTQELNASITVRKAELADARLKIEKSKIKAPFDGVIYDESVEISQVVQAGQSVGMLVDVSVLEIPVDLNVENIGHFNFKDKYPCTIFWDAQSNGPAQWEGFISRVERIMEASRTVRVVVEAPNRRASPRLTKGMFCRVVLPGRSYKDAIAIPPGALHDNDTVYIEDGGKLQIKKVAVLERLEGEVVIGSGISDGDKLITSAITNPVTGMQLKFRLTARGSPNAIE